MVSSHGLLEKIKNGDCSWAFHCLSLVVIRVNLNHISLDRKSCDPLEKHRMLSRTKIKTNFLWWPSDSNQYVSEITVWDGKSKKNEMTVSSFISYSK